VVAMVPDRCTARRSGASLPNPRCLGQSFVVENRKFLRLAAGAAALPAATRLARAETYPSRPVRLIVGAVPGSAPDVIARLIAQSLAERLGQSFIVENRSGASGNLATEAVARAAPDGYTLLLVSAGNAISTRLVELAVLGQIRAFVCRALPTNTSVREDLVW
jgi:tripartite-type tricarboxylate transporter receptor subunit TctC